MDPHALLIPIHAIAASLVILLAPVNILRRRKDRAHKTLGRTWVIAMYLVCVSGMFIYTIGGFTVFHALAIFTFATTTFGVIAIRRGNVRSHIGNMVGSWLGALAAGAFAAFVPGRFIPTLAVSDPAVLWSAVAAIVIAATAWVAFVLARFGAPARRRVPRAALIR
ncbi:DUF2306 domain-containing protein [Microbacterium sp. JZ37]|uniref:DUF2306 domain-containing protein n=1 Tax=Microbacterium sp. JZ37 TaxID=2654193 RepID=UPI002B469BED|nr:DUF2306 domain-containing protein [Microbacterium sp. JZ37]WRH16361.1 DUF2306 domain-containing protein [Microbacterium sp. JZ37]